MSDANEPRPDILKNASLRGPAARKQRIGRSLIEIESRLAKAMASAQVDGDEEEVRRLKQFERHLFRTAEIAGELF